MARYEFVCEHGSYTTTAPMAEGPGDPPFCPECNGFMRRVFTVAVSNLVELKRERERGGARAVRDLFLPTAKELAGPGDPDGEKGIRAWADEHQPKPGNAKPLYPDIPKKVF